MKQIDTVNDRPCLVVGMLTRDDLIPHLRTRARVDAEAVEAAEAAEAAAAALLRTTTPLPKSVGPGRARTGDALFQTVHL